MSQLYCPRRGLQDAPGGNREPMNSFDRYIFRTTFSAFLLILVSLTTVIWITHALREIDLITNQRQTILVFMGITGLLIPLLLLVIAPIALVVAISFTLNKLNTDSEIVVMNASGMSPWRIFRPFLMVTFTVSMIVVVISAYLAPKGMRELRDWATKVRADLVTNIVQPGRFTPIEAGLTVHIRERKANGQLGGIFIDDRRNPAERATILAELGEIIENERGTFLLLINGSVHRLESTRPDPTIVLFERYAFDLSRFTGGSTVTIYGIRERFVWELMFPDPKDELMASQPGNVRAELHERFVAPIYPFAFVILAFAILGPPRTSRQSRGVSMVTTIAAVSGLRLLGFACHVFAIQSVTPIYILYSSLALAFGAGLYAISRGEPIEPPAAVTDTLTALVQRLQQRFAPA
jgi:lipopolysaccharide export system permease protein